MIIIDSPAAIAAVRAAARVPSPLVDLVADRMAGVVAAFAEAGATWDPDEHGAFAILEAGDGPADFDAIGLGSLDGLLEACWESCFAHVGPARAWEVLHLFSNDGGWTVFVPMDAGWLDPRLLAKLAEESTAPFAGAVGRDNAARSQA